MSTLPQSQLARSGVVGSTAMKIGLGKLKTKAKRRFLSKEQRSTADDEQKNAEAELLFSAITQLRGTAVKIAQLLGMENDLLPDRVRNELTKSYHQVPPLNRVLVGKVINEELGNKPEKLFKSFNPDAIAAASLGQVHQAELDDGSQLAVKVQYPGIHTTIESDLNLLRKLAPSATKFLPKPMRPTKAVLDNAISEVGARLQEETDYALEAENTRWFGEHLKIEGVHIPKVYNEFCAERVLTTELLDGQHLEAWLETNPSQATRNLAAQRIHSVFVDSVLNLRRLHADPNPGNYLYKPDGSIGLIDFGCVKTFSDKFVENLPNLLASFCRGDFQEILANYEAIGIKVTAGDDFDYETALSEFRNWFVEPFLTEGHDFKAHSDYFKRGHEIMEKLSEIPSIDKIQEDFIFFERTAYGLFKVFEQLGATVNVRAGWGLPELDL